MAIDALVALGMPLPEVDTLALLVDPGISESNLKRMVMNASSLGVDP